MPQPSHAHRRHAVAICLACTAAVLALQHASVPFQQWENNARDLLVRFSRRARVDPRLVYLTIDNASLTVADNLFADDLTASPALRKMTAGWPWPRDVYAMILDRLVGAGARAVAFDLLFPMEREGDEALRLGLDQYRDRVVIGSNFVDEQEGAASRALSIEAASVRKLTQPAPNLISAPDHDDRVGFVNFWPDAVDEVIRRARYRLSEREILGTVGAQNYSSLAARVLEKSGAADKIPSGERALRFAPEPDRGGFRPISLYTIFVPGAWSANFQDGAFFKDKIVLIGPHGNSQKDQLNTPFGLLDGPELHLNAINDALTGDFVSETGHDTAKIHLALAGLAVLLLTLFVDQPLVRFFLMVVASAAYVAVAILLYDKVGWLIPVLSPLLTFDVSGIVSLVWQQVLERNESKRVRRIFERFVSKNVVKEVVENRDSYLTQLGGVRKNVVILMTDLRGFTTLTEQADSTQLVAQLNEYFTEMVKCVFAANGTLDKFIGDAILAVWGNVRSDGPARDAELAVTTALRMLDALRELNAEWPARGWPQLHMGIGLNFGEVIFGALGSEEKAEPTVIGDPVNLASRLEGLTKEYGIDLAIGESVAELIRDKFRLQDVDFVRVKGKTKPINVYTVLGPMTAPLDDATVAYLEKYRTALATYGGGDFLAAIALFNECLTLRPNDPLARMYVARCHKLHDEPREEKWDGVFVMTTK